MEAKPEILHCAEALAALALASGTPDSFAQQVTDVLDFVGKRPEIRRLLSDGTVRDEGKAEAVGELLEPHLDPMLNHFLCGLIESKRFRHLPAIAEAFYEHMASREHSISGELVAPAPLSDAQVTAIETAAAEYTGKAVSLHVRVDAGLLGGLKLRLGNTIIDDTLDHRLEQIRRQLVEARL